jgi:hypothetical protein
MTSSMWRGPMPPWPASVDIVTWLQMSSEARAEHIRSHAQKEGWRDADTDRVIEYWDQAAALMAMGSRERAEQIRRYMEQAWVGYPAEIEPQTARWINAWDEIVGSRR